MEKIVAVINNGAGARACALWQAIQDPEGLDYDFVYMNGKPL